LMSAAAEGQIRDWLSRVFLLNELPSGELLVEEIALNPSNAPETYDSQAAWHPFLEDENGNIYFWTVRSGGSVTNETWKTQIESISRASKTVWKRNIILN